MRSKILAITAGIIAGLIILAPSNAQEQTSQPPTQPSSADKSSSAAIILLGALGLGVAGFGAGGAVVARRSK